MDLELVRDCDPLDPSDMSMDLGSAESAKLLKSFMLKGDGEGVGTKDNAGVVEMLMHIKMMLNFYLLVLKVKTK